MALNAMLHRRCQATLPTRSQPSTTRLIQTRAYGCAIHPGLSNSYSVIRYLRTRDCRAQAAHPELAELQTLPTLAVLEGEADEGGNPFRYPLGMDAQLKTLASIPGAVFYPLLAAMVAAGAGAAGLGVSRLPVWSRDERPMAAAGAAAVVAIAGASAAMQAKKKRDGAAYVELYNKLASLETPSQLTSQDLSNISSKYMINWNGQIDGLKTIYGVFLESMIPSGETQLRGDESEQIRGFMETLGLSEDDAAQVHLDVGRRLNSRTFETKDRAQSHEQRKAFQRLIYVSSLVFGEAKAAFLLPWARQFNLNPQYVFIAKRDNAKAVFRSLINGLGADIQPDRKALHELRDLQQKFKVADESAQEVVGEFIRKHVEQVLQPTVENATARGRNKDYTPTVTGAAELIEYRRKLHRYSNEEDLVPGLAQVSIKGSSFDEDNKRREMADVYRIYLDESLARTGSFSDALEADLQELQQILMLPAKDAASIQEDVCSALYKKLLRDEVRSQRIDQAESPAAVLEQLCIATRFSPEQALRLHTGLYSKKMSEVIERRKVSDEDEAELQRIQRILCIPSAEVFRIKKEVAGQLLKEALDEVYQQGAKPVSEYETEKLSDLAKALKLDQEVVMEVFSEVTRLRFMSYVMASKKVKNKKEASGMLKQLVQFNVFVATPIVEKLKGYDAAKAQLAEIMAEAVKAAGAEEAAEAAAKGEAVEVEEKSMSQQATDKFTQMMAESKGEDTDKKGQREVNIAKDIDLKDRQQLYKDYLISTMSSDVTELPVGGMMRKKANTSSSRAENWRLGELAAVLGMNQMDIAGVHSDLTEQAYKANLQEALRGTGSLSPDRKAQLAAMRAQLGISEERGNELMRETRTQIMGVSAATADGEAWSLVKVIELADAGVDVEKATSEQIRANLYRKEIEKKVSDGSGNVDVQELLTTLPAKIKLEKKYVDRALKEVVGTRKRLLLVQAVSGLRQKQDLITPLSNLAACWRLAPDASAMAWTERDELKELYTAYATKVQDSTKLLAIQQAFGLEDSELVELNQRAESSAEAAARAAEEDEDNFF